MELLNTNERLAPNLYNRVPVSYQGVEQMRRIYALTGIAFLAALVGGAAYALAQQQAGTELPNLQTLPPLPAPPRAGTLPPPPSTIPGLSTAPTGPGLSPVTPATTPRETTTAMRPFTLPIPAPTKNAGFDDLPHDSLQAPTTAIGKQEPAISMEWVGPPTTKLGQPADYSLVLRNVSNSAIQQVQARVRVPSGLTMTSMEPKAIFDNGIMKWDLGTMQPKQEQSLKLRFVADAKGVVVPQAWVTFTGAAVMNIKVCEPRLALKVGYPDKILVGDAAKFNLNVSNPGDGPADQVRLLVNLSQGLEHPKGDKIELEIGTLAAGETRAVQLVCNARVGGAKVQLDGGSGRRPHSPRHRQYQRHSTAPGPPTYRPGTPLSRSQGHLHSQRHQPWRRARGQRHAHRGRACRVQSPRRQ